MELSVRIPKCAFAKAASYYISVQLEGGKCEATEVSEISTEPSFEKIFSIPEDLGAIKENAVFNFEAFVVLTENTSSEPQLLGKASISILSTQLQELPFKKSLTFIRNHGTDSEIPVGKMNLEIGPISKSASKNNNEVSSIKRRSLRRKSSNSKLSENSSEINNNPQEYEMVLQIHHFIGQTSGNYTCSLELETNNDDASSSSGAVRSKTIPLNTKDNMVNWNERLSLMVPRAAEESGRKLCLRITESKNIQLEAKLPLVYLASHRANTLYLNWPLKNSSALITITKHDSTSVTSVSIVHLTKLELRLDTAITSDSNLVAVAQLVDTAVVDSNTCSWLEQIDANESKTFPLTQCQAENLESLPMDSRGNFDLPGSHRKPTLKTTSNDGKLLHWENENLIFPIPSNSKYSWCPTSCTNFPSFGAPAVLLIDFFLVAKNTHTHFATTMSSLADITDGRSVVEAFVNKTDGTTLGNCSATLHFETRKKKRKSTRKLSVKEIPIDETKSVEGDTNNERKMKKAASKKSLSDEDVPISPNAQENKRRKSKKNATSVDNDDTNNERKMKKAASKKSLSDEDVPISPNAQENNRRKSKKNATSIDNDDAPLYAVEEKQTPLPQELAPSGTISELARELSESKLEIGGLRACLEHRDKALSENEAQLNKMRSLVTELDQERRRLADDIKEREEQRVRDWQRMQFALQSNTELTTSPNLKSQFRVLAEMYAHARNQIDAMQHVQSEEKRLRKHYERLKEIHAKSFQEYENQNAYIKRLQKDISKLEAYKTTVKMQEEVIKKLEHIVDAKLQEMCRQRIAEANAVEAQLSKFKNREEDQDQIIKLREEFRHKEADHNFVIEAKNHRIRILEEQLIGKANEHGKQIADLKLKIFHLEMQSENGQPPPIWEGFDDPSAVTNNNMSTSFLLGGNRNMDNFDLSNAARSPEGPVPNEESAYLKVSSQLK